jgi:hypothetical protein
VGEGPGEAGGVGQGAAELPALRPKIVDEHFEERAFAVEEMLAAFDVEEEAFRMFGVFEGGERAEAGAGLEGELVEGFAVGLAVDREELDSRQCPFTDAGSVGYGECFGFFFGLAGAEAEAHRER